MTTPQAYLLQWPEDYTVCKDFLSGHGSPVKLKWTRNVRILKK